MAKASVTDCCICLFSVTICQSLFIAPCSHVFHYKCIRPLLSLHHPGFSCPLCRSFADLEADVETEDAWEVASRRESLVSRRGSLKSVKQAFEQGLVSALAAGEEGQDGDEEEAANGPVEGGSRDSLDMEGVGERDGESGDVPSLSTPAGRIIASTTLTRLETERPDTAVAPLSGGREVGGIQGGGESSGSVLQQEVVEDDEQDQGSTPIVHSGNHFPSTPTTTPDSTSNTNTSSGVYSSTPTPSPLGVNNPFAALPPHQSTTSPSSSSPPSHPAPDLSSTKSSTAPPPAATDTNAVAQSSQTGSPSSYSSNPLQPNNPPSSSNVPSSQSSSPQQAPSSASSQESSPERLAAQLETVSLAPAILPSSATNGGPSSDLAAADEKRSGAASATGQEERRIDREGHVAQGEPSR